MAKRTCSIDGCDRPLVGRGWCSMHWQRWQKHGDPMAMPQRRIPEPIDPWSRIDQSGGPDACWPWTHRLDQDGYGTQKRSGRQIRVHRWVLEQKLGRPLGEGEVTRHTCDNPPCCNPAHLLPGTPADNVRDMVERGRTVSGDSHWARRTGGLLGEANGAARLVERQVREIRARYAAGETQVALAAAFNTSQFNVSSIVRGATWSHI